MDTTSIITQLMQLESQAQTLLKNRLATIQTKGAAYRDINKSFAALHAAAAINASGLGLSATIVQLSPTNFHLQVSGSATGLANAFTLQSSTETATTAGSAFSTSVPASDAVLSLVGTDGLQATSSTNTF